MKTIVAASILATAAAFAPASQKAASTTAIGAVAKKPVKKAAAAAKKVVSKIAKKASATRSFENEVGAQVPLGFWDPLGLVADGNQETFDRLRGVELKHGRVSMLAVVGYLVTEAGIRLPGVISSSSGLEFSSIPSGFAALSVVPLGGLAQIFLFAGYLEIAGWKQAEGSFPGDFSASSFPVGFLGNMDEETKLKKRAIELNNGRAAQMGILALMVHEQLGVSILP
jgi:hypothetical protein